MERRTVEAYEERGRAWAANRRPARLGDAAAFAASVPDTLARADLGCGSGRHIREIGPGGIGLDAARAMLELCRDRAPEVPLVQGDVEALPFGRHSLHGGWANMSYHHLPRTRLPMALADLHRALAPGAPIDLQVVEGTYEGDALPDDDIGGRYFAAWRPEHLADVLVGAGFDEVTVSPVAPASATDVLRARARRARTLADTVGAGMCLLVVGLNPSLHAADTGVGFGRPGNRFWPAALAAGLVTRDRDPTHALVGHGVGMTDLVKRATPRADALSASEYRRGLERVDRLVRWLSPGAVCLVGLGGWRAAGKPHAEAGLQAERIGGRPTYVMPSTSGANAHASLDELRAHLAAAASSAGSVGRVHEADGPLH